MTALKIIFMGTPDFAVPTLDALVDAGHELLCVVAQPDQRQGRGKKLRSPDTVLRARELGIPTRQPRAVRRGPFPEWFESCGADLAVVVAYGRILTPRLLAGPRLGCMNVHASLLPRYRGAAPIQWAVIHGEPETGVCTMKMDQGLDTGDVLLDARTPIGPDETAGELWTRLSQMGAALALDTVARWDTLTPRPQDHAAHTLAPLLAKTDGLIDWSWPAQRVHDRVRGVNPWPGGQTVFREQPLKIWRTRVVNAQGPAGGVLDTGGGVVVGCGQGAVQLVEVQLPGKRRVPGAAFANGAHVRVGEVLG